MKPSEKGMSNVCDHGGLRRKCEICELEAKVATLRQAVAHWEDKATTLYHEKCALEKEREATGEVVEVLMSCANELERLQAIVSEEDYDILETRLGEVTAALENYKQVMEGKG